MVSRKQTLRFCITAGNKANFSAILVASCVMSILLFGRKIAYPGVLPIQLILHSRTEKQNQ